MFKLEVKPNIHIISRRLLYLFITLIIANGISEIPFVSEIAKIGKFAVLGVGLVLLSTQRRLIRFTSGNRWLFLFWILCILFSVYQLLTGIMDNQTLITNVTFILYIYFFYLLVDALTFESRSSKTSILLVVTHCLSKVLNENLVFWSLIGLGFGIPVWHQLDDRIGLGLFYNSYIQMGIYGVCGAIIHLLLLKFDKVSKKHLIWFSVYLFIVILSNSRNAQLILAIVTLLLFANSIIRFLIRYRWIVLASLTGLVIYMGNIYSFLLNERVLQLTTGRSTIWSYVLGYYEQESIFSGRGIFGLNNEILTQNKSANYYFDRIDFLYFHNSYIEFFAATGLLGFIAILLYFISNLRKMRKSALNAVLIGIMCGAFFESFLIQPVILITLIFWLYLFTNQATAKELKLKNSRLLINQTQKLRDEV